jgi:SRC kinase signaling inhibitor 1
VSRSRNSLPHRERTDEHYTSDLVSERDRLKPVPPLKQTSVNQYRGADLTLAPEAYNHLRALQKKTKDLRTEVKTLRRLAQTQAVAVREDIKDTFMRIRATLLASNGNHWGQGDQERVIRLVFSFELS